MLADDHATARGLLGSGQFLALAADHRRRRAVAGPGLQEARRLPRREHAARAGVVQLENQLRDNIAPELLAGVFFVAEDPRLATAVWDGAPAGPGPFTRAISEVTRRVVPVVAGQGRRTKAKASR